MMILRNFILATLAVAVLSTTSFADGPFDRFLPRGRLLRKLRDDVLGTPEPKQPTLAAKPKSNLERPTPAARLAVPKQDQARRTNQSKQPAVVHSGANGFGMSVVVDKQENIIVAQVAPAGNAAEAGLQRGDLIAEAGGVELTSIEEYQEITKMLGAGDQLEFKIARRGRPSTVMLQHGQPPTLDDVEVGEMNTKLGNSANQSQGNQYQQDFSFVPPGDDSSRASMRSVVEQPFAPVRSVSTQQHAMGQSRTNRVAVPPQRLQQTVSQQQSEIQRLQQQLDQLRRQQGMTGSGVRRP